MPLSCFILFSIWLLRELHILLNPCEKNEIGMDVLFFGMFILFCFALFYLDTTLQLFHKKNIVQDFLMYNEFDPKHYKGK